MPHHTLLKAPRILLMELLLATDDAASNHACPRKQRACITTHLAMDGVVPSLSLSHVSAPSELRTTYQYDGA